MLSRQVSLGVQSSDGGVLPPLRVATRAGCALDSASTTPKKRSVPPSPPARRGEETPATIPRRVFPERGSACRRSLEEGGPAGSPSKSSENLSVTGSPHPPHYPKPRTSETVPVQSTQLSPTFPRSPLSPPKKQTLQDPCGDPSICHILHEPTAKRNAYKEYVKWDSTGKNIDISDDARQFLVKNPDYLKELDIGWSGSTSNVSHSPTSQSPERLGIESLVMEQHSIPLSTNPEGAPSPSMLKPPARFVQCLFKRGSKSIDMQLQGLLAAAAVECIRRESIVESSTMQTEAWMLEFETQVWLPAPSSL